MFIIFTFMFYIILYIYVWMAIVIIALEFRFNNRFVILIQAFMLNILVVLKFCWT